MSPSRANASSESQQRNLVPVSPRLYPTYVDRWAIVVGISRYQHERLNLKYAHRDAEELYKLLQTPSGGGFEADHIVKLIDEEATTLKAGAPLGHTGEVQLFLSSRKAAPTNSSK